MVVNRWMEVATGAHCHQETVDFAMTIIERKKAVKSVSAGYNNHQCEISLEIWQNSD